jgi:hypothetical protein
MACSKAPTPGKMSLSAEEMSAADSTCSGGGEGGGREEEEGEEEEEKERAGVEFSACRIRRPWSNF